jgi:hypothetical protein
MPHRHVKPVPVVAASPAMIAAMPNTRPDDLADATAKEQIKVFQRGARRRILIEDAKAADARDRMVFYEGWGFAISIDPNILR